MSSLPLPRLLHPILVKMRLIDKATTTYDHDAREPVGKARRVMTELYAHIMWKSLMYHSQREGGEIRADGYVLFLLRDLSNLGIDIQYGDQIYQIGRPPSQRNVNLYIEDIVPCGHNPNSGGHTMIKAMFTSKTPVRHQ